MRRVSVNNDAFAAVMNELEKFEETQRVEKEHHIEGLLQKKRKNLRELSTAAKAVRFRHEEGRRTLRSKILQEADVLCCTLNGSAVHELSELAFDCVIIDEACQSTEPESLIPLQYHARKLILVGDPNQLPATVKSTTAAKAGLLRSLFERIKPKVHSWGALRILTVQYRMHREICAFPSEQFYENKLGTDSSVLLRPPAVWQVADANSRYNKPYMVFNTEGREKTDRDQTSFYNEYEAHVAVYIIYSLCRQYPSLCFAGKIAIIAPYKRQIEYIKTLLSSRFGHKVINCIDIGTVDGFQGKEVDIVIFTCVRTSSIGFLENAKRMNVALTRARHSLFVIGCVHALSTAHNSENWQALFADAAKRQVLRDLYNLVNGGNRSG